LEVIHKVLDKVQGDQRDLRQESLLSLGILNAKSDKKIVREKDKKGEKEQVKREREREKEKVKREREWGTFQVSRALVRRAKKVTILSSDCMARNCRTSCELA